MRNIIFLKELIQGFSITWKAGKSYAIYNIVVTLLLSLLPLVSLWYVKEIIDLISAFSTEAREEFLYALACLVLIQLLQAALQQLLVDIQTVQQQLCIDYLSARVLEKAVSVDYPYYENAGYFNSLHQAQQEVIYKTGVLTSGYHLALQSGLSLLLLSVVFLQFNWLYGLLVMAAGIPVLVVKYRHAKAIQQLEKQNVATERQAYYLNRTLTEAAHAKEVRTYGYGTYFIERFNDLRQLVFVGKKKLSGSQARAEILIHAVEILVLGFIIYELGGKTLEGVITTGSFIFYFQALQRLQSSMRNFVTGFTQLFRQRFFLKNVYDFLELPVKQTSEVLKKAFPSKLEAGIALHDVSFAYPGNAKAVLHHVSMRFEAGKVTAIIGENGSGKSTLVKLLSRLYQPDTGLLTIDQLSYESISSGSFAKNVAVLFQDYNQYHFSLAENITLGVTTDPHTLDAAAADADLQHLKGALPRGFNTTLGKMFGDEAQLSGGQWQKIALARALYRQARLLILDEPTSNIDPLAEHEILRKIAASKEDKVIILITHRLHNLKFADHVYLLDDGEVNGEGTVAELLQDNPLFRQMYQRQQLPASQFTTC